MRVPPLPAPSVPWTAEQLAARAVGSAPAGPPAGVTISDYDPTWPKRYAVEEVRIRDALGPLALEVEHVGSTAVEGLPAKDRLDIDLIVADPSEEEAYVPALTAAGYTLRTREPHWYEHRCLWTAGHDVNLHVFGPDCDEYLRHVIFRDWLRANPDDRDRYAAEKRRVAATEPTIVAYVAAKSAIVTDILRRAGLR
jgi:GrpB-like predicted nucleotidyltransferase (UPF0157 family)